MSRYEILVLGAGTALGTAAKSNYLLRRKNGKKGLLIDCGAGIEQVFSVRGISHHDVGGVYLSHRHFDHAGGLDWFALRTKFDPSYNAMESLIPPRHEPALYVPESLLGPLYADAMHTFGATTDGVLPLNRWFLITAMQTGQRYKWDMDCEIWCMPVPHMQNKKTGEVYLYSYALWVKTFTGTTLFTTDTKTTLSRAAYREADLIFHDGEQPPSSPVHTPLESIYGLPRSIRKKVWVTHWQRTPTETPPENRGLRGFLEPGMVIALP